MFIIKVDDVAILYVQKTIYNIYKNDNDDHRHYIIRVYTTTYVR